MVLDIFALRAFLELRTSFLQLLQCQLFSMLPHLQALNWATSKLQFLHSHPIS